MNDSQIRQHLRDCGYHRHLDLRGHEVATAADSVIERMVIYYQFFHGLLTDGVVGPKTQCKMSTMRCGCPDHIRMPSARVPAFGEACRLSVGVYADWSGIKGISPSYATEVMAANFKQAEKFNLRMAMVDDPRDALISIRMGPAKPGVLAWMEVGDGCGWQHQSLFNIDVNWSDDVLFAGTNMHEVVGHGAGVGHSASIGSIMDPSYDPNVRNIIDPWFSTELERRYGLSNGNVPTPEPPTTTNPPGVPNMIWVQLVEMFYPILLACLEANATDAKIEGAIRVPSGLQQRILRKGIKGHVREHLPNLRGRRNRDERRGYVNATYDSLLLRGRDATSAEIKMLIDEVRQKRQQSKAAA